MSRRPPIFLRRKPRLSLLKHLRRRPSLQNEDLLAHALLSQFTSHASPSLNRRSSCLRNPNPLIHSSGCRNSSRQHSSSTSRTTRLRPASNHGFPPATKNHSQI